MQKTVSGGCERKLRDEGAEKETKGSTHSEVLIWLHADHLLAKALWGIFIVSNELINSSGQFSKTYP